MPPRGYANGVAARGTTICVAGQIGWNERCEFASDDFVEQTRQALHNIRAVLEAGGAQPQHLVRMTWYVTDKKEYLAALPDVGAAWRELIGRHYPAMAVVQVAALMEDEARVEIETTTVIP